MIPSSGMSGGSSVVGGSVVGGSVVSGGDVSATASTLGTTRVCSVGVGLVPHAELHTVSRIRD